MARLLEVVRKAFDYIIIDGSAGIGDGIDLAAMPADTVVVVTEDEVASIRDADIVDRELIKMGKTNKYAVINKVNPELIADGVVPNFEEISRGLRMKIAGIIQFDRNIFIATNKGMPIVMKLGTYIERNFSKIVKRIIDDEV